MLISPLNTPINISICKSDGTIFSTPNSGGSGTSNLTFSNLGVNGARIYAQTIANNVQFRRVTQGNNVVITERTNDLVWDVNDLKFDSSAPIKRAISGLQGIVLNKQGILSTLQELLYPIIPPVVTINTILAQFELGDNTNLITNWSVARTDEQIVSITIGGISQTVTGNSQSGTFNQPKTGLVNISIIAQAVTATSITSATTSSIASRKLRFGTTNKDGLIAQILDSDINGLQSVFSSTPTLPSTALIVGVGQYLIISIPVALGSTPVFKVNGFVNNAFNLVRTNSAFINSFGFSDPVNVWVSQSFSTGSILLEID